MLVVNWCSFGKIDDSCSNGSMTDGLPPIHDLVRFWSRSQDATIGACVQFRKMALPRVSHGWLREAAPIVMTRELPENTLRNAVRQRVYYNAQASVLKAVELFVKFAGYHEWTGKPLIPTVYRLPNGQVTTIRAIGRYFSQRTKSEWLVALQPRQDNVPNEEQFRMWRTALSLEFGLADEATMIVDLSKNVVTQKRELREITSRKFAALSKDELDARFELIASCYAKAVEIVPERPAPLSGKREDPRFPF